MIRLALALSILFVATFSAAAPASAQKKMDITTHRLYNGTSDLSRSEAQQVADGRFGSLMSQLAGALEPTVLTPANTLGSRGFYLGFESGVSQIDNQSEYWRLGTHGGANATEAGNAFPQGALTHSRGVFRKGLPFGIDLGLGIGHVYQSNLFLWSVEVKVALFEGWFKKWPRFLPDIALQGFATTITGSREFSLTVPGGGLILSKPIVLGHSALLTPMVHARAVGMLADSELVYAAGLPDSSQITAFQKMRGYRIRIAPGLQFQYQKLVLTGSFSIDVTDPTRNEEIAGADALSGQWRVDFGVGFQY